MASPSTTNTAASAYSLEDMKIFKACGMFNAAALAKFFTGQVEHAELKAIALEKLIATTITGDRISAHGLYNYVSFGALDVELYLLKPLSESGLVNYDPHNDFAPITPGAKLVEFLKAGLAKAEVGDVLLAAVAAAREPSTAVDGVSVESFMGNKILAGVGLLGWTSIMPFFLESDELRKDKCRIIEAVAGDAISGDALHFEKSTANADTVLNELRDAGLINYGSVNGRELVATPGAKLLQFLEDGLRKHDNTPLAQMVRGASGSSPQH